MVPLKELRVLDLTRVFVETLNFMIQIDLEVEVIESEILDPNNDFKHFGP
jgi:hypothetical protein